jgi:proline iminopeptidase
MKAARFHHPMARLFWGLVFLFFAISLAIPPTGCRRLDDEGVLVPPTVEQDANLPSVTITVAGQTLKLHTLTYGVRNQPVLFVLHGSYSDNRAYQDLCRRLSERYFVVCWAQRGCGLSERITREEFSLASAYNEIKAMKEYYSPNAPVTLVGHSWGGGIATGYAGQHPTDVKQLAVIEPMPLKAADMDKLWSEIFKLNLLAAEYNDFGRSNEVLAPKDHAALDYRAQMQLRNSMARYHCDQKNAPQWPIWRVGAQVELYRSQELGYPGIGFKYDFTKGLSNYTTPVLILGGTCGGLRAEIQREYTLKHFVDARVESIGPAGHRLIVEQLDLTTTALFNYLKP